MKRAWCNKAKLLILSGPSGVGKNTLGEKLLKYIGENQLRRVITYTTRSPRPTEKNGEDYHFISREKFLQMIKNSEFFEHAMVYGDNFYGQAKADIEKILSQGINALLIMDPSGVKTILAKKTNFKIFTIFVTFKDIEDLRKRIYGRGTENNEEIMLRLQMAEHEIKDLNIYDHVIESSSPEDDFRSLLKIYNNL